MKKAFTLVELLVVIAVISLLMAIIVPVLHRVRQQGDETVCKSKLRQLALILKNYTNDNDSLFPHPSYIYHSPASFSRKNWGPYLICCRWHDARMGLDGPLLRDHPELRGTLWPYLGKKDVVLCKIGKRANELRGCYNYCPPIPDVDPGCPHNPEIPVVAQYTYSMNGYLASFFVRTGTSESGAPDAGIDRRTVRMADVRRETQVTRSPSEVFAFGGQNSWAINTEGRQPLYHESYWPAPYDLSGKYYRDTDPPGWRGTLRLPVLKVLATYQIGGSHLIKDGRYIGDAFATCHRPLDGDLNAGHSFVSMLDGHVKKVTLADQLRKSRRVPGLEDSKLGPGGNLALAWPLDIPPPGGWDHQ